MNRSHGPAVGLMAGGTLAIAVGLAAGRWGPPDSPATELAIVAVRAALVGVGAYAVLVGALTLLAALFGWSRAQMWALRLGGARWGVALSVGVAAVAASPTLAAAESPQSVPMQSLTPLDSPGQTTTVSPPPTPVASLVPLPAEVDEDAPVDAAEIEPADPASTWTVEQGDHLWAIAERAVLEEHPDADDATITSYWLALVDANREQLVVRDNPDLILPGQRLVLPPVG